MLTWPFSVTRVEQSGGSSWAHNPKVAGSNPAPATTFLLLAVDVSDCGVSRCHNVATPTLIQ